MIAKLMRAVNHWVPVWKKQNQQAGKNGKNNIDNCQDFGKDNSRLIGNDESNSFCGKQGRGNVDTGIACS